MRIDVHLPRLHSQQKQVATSQARFKVLASGRRWGKTRLGSLLCLTTGLRGGRAWWVAPTYKMARVGWRGIKELAVQIPGAAIHRGDLMVGLPGGGEVWVRSADNPDSLRGEGLDFVVMDECAFMREEAWQHALRPALSDRLGGALFISTPKGRNWFWRTWHNAQDGEAGEWDAWQFPTAGNPFIAAGEIEAARAGLPERIFAQEYLAQFLDDAGGVFRKVMEAATATEQEEPQDGHDYIFGVDWARTNDYTVFAVLDVTDHALVAMDRFNQTEYAVQVGRLKALYRRFRPRVIIAEYNSMGGPIVETLQREGLPVQAFTTTSVSKQQAIDSLALAFESGDITVIPDQALIAELQAYEGQRMPSGAMRYSAPSGMHDDTVMALAIAWSGLSDGPVMGSKNPFYE